MTQSFHLFRDAKASSTPSVSGIRLKSRALSCAVLLLGLADPASAQGSASTVPETPAQAATPTEASSAETAAHVETAATHAPAAEPDATKGEASTAPDARAPSEEEGASASLPTEGDAPQVDATDTGALVEPPLSGLSPEQSRALWPLTWKKSPGQGVALGLEEGLWGGSWGQGLRVTLPFGAHFSTTLRGIYLIDMADGPITVDAGGRIDFIGRSDVLFNVMRLYGGGGVQMIAPVANTTGKEARVGGGGHFGFEFFCSPHYSFFLEVGGQGGTVSPGATVLTGMMFYPWTK